MHAEIADAERRSRSGVASAPCTQVYVDRTRCLQKIRQSQDHDIRTSTDEMNGVQMGEMPGTHIGFSKIPDGGLDNHDRSGKTLKTR